MFQGSVQIVKFFPADPTDQFLVNPRDPPPIAIGVRERLFCSQGLHGVTHRCLDRLETYRNYSDQ